MFQSSTKKNIRLLSHDELLAILLEMGKKKFRTNPVVTSLAQRNW
ncbi:MAG: hypothetical protein R2788_01590 [Saprospiraceae bacterium]